MEITEIQTMLIDDAFDLDKEKKIMNSEVFSFSFSKKNNHLYIYIYPFEFYP
jgi:hypothetical protein